jgi:hypothetical protein
MMAEKDFNKILEDELRKIKIKVDERMTCRYPFLKEGTEIDGVQLAEIQHREGMTPVQRFDYGRKKLREIRKKKRK